MFAAHMVYDPLFGQLVRREFFQRLAPLFGDSLTPFFIGPGCRPTSRSPRRPWRTSSTTAWPTMPEYAGYNRRWMRAWTDKWLPRTIAAMTRLHGRLRQAAARRHFTDGQSIAAGVDARGERLDRGLRAARSTTRPIQRKLISTIIGGLK